MISVAEAQALIQARLPGPGAPESLALADCTGRVLAEALRADRDGPPYDRVAMDGIALDSREAAPGDAQVLEFQVLGFQAAGSPPLTRRAPGTALEVATGAVLPLGCDAVVPYEALRRSGQRARLAPELRVEAGLNVHPRGKDYGRGELLIPEGTLLRSPHTHLLATCGASRVLVRARATWAIAATGDELVAIEQAPGPHQIRRSNGAALRAEAFAWGLRPLAETTLADQREALASGLLDLLDNVAVLVLTGGVSRGALDLVPEVLLGLGVQEIFHGVAQKPGKPLWFGVSAAGTLIFGLPGNPVAALMAFRRYVLPTLLALEGRRSDPVFASVRGLPPWTGSFSQFVPVAQGPDGFTPGPRGGSGDLRPLALSEGFVQWDPGVDPAQPLPYYAWGLPGGLP